MAGAFVKKDKTDLTVWRRFIFSVITGLFFALSSTGSTLVAQETVKRDTDEDGKIDQIAYFDKRGRIIKLEIDGNGDEAMDRFQFYEEEKLVRIERDTDHDRKVDCRDFIRDDKRIRQERDSGGSGRVNQVILFDDLELPLNR